MRLSSLPDGAESHAAQQLILQQERNNDDGDDEQRLDRRHQAPIDANLTADGAGDRHRHGARFGAGQHQREQELVPGEDHRENEGGGEPAIDLRQADLAEHVPFGTAVHPRGVFDVAIEMVEEALGHPDRERQVEGGVEGDDAGIGPAQSEDAEQHEDWNDRDDRRQHARRQNDEQIGFVAAQGKAREAIGRRSADDQGEKDAGAADEQTVEEIQAEARIGAAAARDVGAHEHRIEILEGRREQELDRHRQRVGARLERGHDDVEDRKEIGEADHSGANGARPACVPDRSDLASFAHFTPPPGAIESHRDRCSSAR